MVDKKDQLSIRKQCKLLEISRSSLYFKLNGEMDFKQLGGGNPDRTAERVDRKVWKA